MEPRQLMIVAGSGAAALLCFFPWWKVSVSGGPSELQNMFGGMPGSSANAFGTWEGVVVFLLSIATGALIPLTRAGIVRMRKEHLLMAPLGGSAVAVLLMLVLFGQGGGNGPISVGHTFWFYLAFLALGLVVWKSFESWKAASVRTPPAA